jgi:PRTRC genetic system protein C
MNTPNVVSPKRSFNYNGMQLDDPDPSMSPEKVIEFHALLHAELTNATVKGPSVGGDGTQNYQVEVQIGDFN